MGTVIQTFGRKFVNNINFLISDNFYKTANSSSYKFNITNISPFSICGNFDTEMLKYTTCERTNLRVKTDILKNFDEMLEIAHANYFLIDNGCADIWLNKINNQFYSVMGGEKTDFTDRIYNYNPKEAEKNCIKPVSIGITKELREQYDLFVEAILRHYDSDHVILIPSICPRFYNKNGEIMLSEIPNNRRKFLHELDEYFALRTGCFVISTPERFFQATVNERLRFELEKDIITVCKANHKLRKSAFRVDLNDLKYIREDKESEAPQNQNLLVNLLRCCDENRFATLEHIANLKDKKTNSLYIMNYFRYVDYSFDDIVALFYLYNKTKTNSKEFFKEIAFEILANKESSVYKHTKELFEKNRMLLSDYAYCMINNIDSIPFKEQVVIRFSDRTYLKISHDSDFEIIKLSPCKSWNWDYKKFINNNYTCGIDDIEDALSSCALYFERGRKNDLSPMKLQFNDFDEFTKSLYYIDYAEILDNENYCITLPESQDPNEYKPKVELSFLFDPKVRIVMCSAGLGDQLQYYARGKRIEERHSVTVYFNDLNFDRVTPFNGLEIKNFIGEDKWETDKKKFFSNIFSKKLRLQIKEKIQKQQSLVTANPEVLYTLGLKEMILTYFRGGFKTAPSCDFMVFYKLFESEKIFVQSKVSSPIFYLGWTIPCWSKKFWEDICNFPAITDSKNLEIQEKMLSTDAYVLHIRRGDYVKLGWSKDTEYFKNLVEISFKIAEYTNKHLFIFSDDIGWVKENSKNMSLDLFRDNITYINHNHHYESFRDMQLMTLGKVIIPGGSSLFSNTAAKASKRVEYIFGGSIVPNGKTFIRRKINSDGTHSTNFDAYK